ncbi:MAG TPA: metabolite traffic protein EboE [Candidatus Saccharimonadales bacterium]|nr:metabolite traffic protein EboE [Candidatus Saccharimonadales bacterium]
MKLKHDLHLAYCTNIHRGETWPETLAALETFTLAVRERVCAGRPYAIGLRLSDQASRELSEPTALLAFQRWLERHQCYVFTINGFPFGCFHGQRVKEQVYFPDWTSSDRVNYTNRLFDLLAQLVPPGVEGSVSTVPGSFKEPGITEDQLARMRANIFSCVEHIARLSKRTGRTLHLGLEPEPLCVLETTAETVEFFGRLREENSDDGRLKEFLGVNYDTCHLAVEFEDPVEGLARLRNAGIKISKLHLSSALKLRPTADALAAVRAFADDTYLHQVVARAEDGSLTRYKDLGLALADSQRAAEEWRIHFHIPLHSPPAQWFDNTTDHLLGILDLLEANPQLCSHLEMETYTWDVMPPELRSRDVVEQLTLEYEWCLKQLRARGLV